MKPRGQKKSRLKPQNQTENMKTKDHFKRPESSFLVVNKTIWQPCLVWQSMQKISLLNYHPSQLLNILGYKNKV